MTPSQDTLLFAFWTGLFAGFSYLWSTMLVTWFARRDSRSMLYVLLLLDLSLICGINAVIRGSALPIDAVHLIATQRGLWVTVLFVAFAKVDMYRAEHARRVPLLTRVWQHLTNRSDYVGQPDPHGG